MYPGSMRYAKMANEKVRRLTKLVGKIMLPTSVRANRSAPVVRRGLSSFMVCE